jgi:formylglycine-generating enzyme required for sulfatase activity
MQEPACVRIPEGWFLIGCESGRDDEKPIHRVWVDAFEMAVLPVRNSEYTRFLHVTGRPAPPDWDKPHFNAPDQPVTSPSWFDATAYCDWMSHTWHRHYRLPTEAEWERAALGGVEGRLYAWGNEPPEENPAYQRRWTGEVLGPRTAGEEPPNEFGVCDLGENVHEWCADWYDPAYYAHSPERNPRGPEHGDRRASRGGSWRHHIKVSRCAARSSIPPHFHYADYGFRVVRDVV